jgi:hypothetical protein
MSNISEYIQNNPHESHRFFGLKYEQLQQLLEKAIELHQKNPGETLNVIAPQHIQDFPRRRNTGDPKCGRS